MKVFVTICLILGIAGIVIDELYTAHATQSIDASRGQAGYVQKQENRWPKYVGFIALGIAVVLLFADKKKTAK